MMLKGQNIRRKDDKGMTPVFKKIASARIDGSNQELTLTSRHDGKPPADSKLASDAALQL